MSLAISNKPYAKAVWKELPWSVRYLVESWFLIRETDGAKALETEILSKLHPTSQLRHRVASDRSEAFLQTIFEASFKHSPDDVIEAAEKETGRLYPLWKRAWKIELPRFFGDFFDNTVVKIVLFATFALFGLVHGVRVYSALSEFLETSVIPLVVDHAPDVLTRVYNAAIGGIDWLYERRVEILLVSWGAREALVLGPEIPYLTPFARSADILSIYRRVVQGAQDGAQFAIDALFDFYTFFNNGCKNLSLALYEIADRANVERHAACKERCYQLWLRQVSPPQIRA